MADKVIALACAAGMSTSLLVSKMQKAAAETEKITKFSQNQQQTLIICLQEQVHQNQTFYF